MLDRLHRQGIKVKPASLIPYLILLLPILGYWLFCNFLKPISPYYQDYDPEFQYFLTSLAGIRGGSYTYIDHPGTPLEIIGSMILLATRPFLSNPPGGFSLYHLEHPGLFLGLARGLIALASIGCSLLFFLTARTTRRWGDVLTAAALSMMFFVIHPDSFATLMLWSHNSFNFAAGTLLLIFLYRLTRREGEARAWELIGIGLGIGGLIAVTIYFIAWAAGAIITLAVFYHLQALPWRKTATAGVLLAGSICAGFFISTLPILPLYPQFVNWITGLAFHEGIYGGGAQGITTPALMLTNFLRLVRDLPVLFLSLGIELLLLLAGFLRRTGSVRPGLQALAIGLVSQLLIELIMIVKHPMDIYMLAVAAILPVLLLLILELFPPVPVPGRILHIAATAGLLAGLVYSFYSALLDRRNYADAIRTTVQQTSNAILQYSLEQGRTPDLLTIYWTYGTYSACQSLEYGDYKTSSEVTEDILQICGRQRGISVWANRVKVFQKDWDILVTRSDFLTMYPFLKGVGVVYRELPGTANEYGPILIIRNTR